MKSDNESLAALETRLETGLSEAFALGRIEGRKDGVVEGYSRAIDVLRAEAKRAAASLEVGTTFRRAAAFLESKGIPT